MKILVVCLFIQHQCTSRSFFLTRICDRSRRSARCFGIPGLQGPGSQGSFTYGAFHAAGTRTKSPHPSPRETSIAGYATTKGVWVGGRKRSKPSYRWDTLTTGDSLLSFTQKGFLPIKFVCESFKLFWLEPKVAWIREWCTAKWSTYTKPAQSTICSNIQHQCTSRSFFLTRMCDRSRRSARCLGIPDLQGPGSQGSFTYGAFHAAGTQCILLRIPQSITWSWKLGWPRRVVNATGAQQQL